MFSLMDALSAHGHTVVPFSMQNPRNLATEYENFFVSNVDYGGDGKNPFKMLHAACRTIYSLEARRNISRLLGKFSPAIAHFHNFSYQLTPSILAPLVKRNIPVVQTLHDYHIICPSHNLFDFNRGEICEACGGGSFMQAVSRSCIKGSKLKSLIGAVEAYLAKYLKVYSEKINLFISPSLFLKKKIVEFGVEEKKIVHLPNFVDHQLFTPSSESSDYFVYFGRLEAFKGIRVLLKAFELVDNAKLYIIGDGSLKEELAKTISDKGLDHVKLLGYKGGAELRRLVGNSRCSIIPSLWYENNPISVLESFALGKPVIGADIGGIPELVEEGKTGLLFQADSHEELSAQIRFFATHRTQAEEMGREARRRVEKIYNPVAHYKNIMELYRGLTQ